jgi:hypothetical protein
LECRRSNSNSLSSPLRNPHSSPIELPCHDKKVIFFFWQTSVYFADV